MNYMNHQEVVDLAWHQGYIRVQRVHAYIECIQTCMNRQGSTFPSTTYCP